MTRRSRSSTRRGSRTVSTMAFASRPASSALSKAWKGWSRIMISPSALRSLRLVRVHCKRARSVRCLSSEPGQGAQIDTTTPERQAHVQHLRLAGRVRAGVDPRTNKGGNAGRTAEWKAWWQAAHPDAEKARHGTPAARPRARAFVRGQRSVPVLEQGDRATHAMAVLEDVVAPEPRRLLQDLPDPALGAAGGLNPGECRSLAEALDLCP